MIIYDNLFLLKEKLKIMLVTNFEVIFLFIYFYLFVYIQTKALHGGVTLLLPVCNFDNGLCPGYSHEAGNFKWRINSGSTPSKLTGPKNDHTLRSNQGKYIYIESSGRLNGETAKFSTPLLRNENGDKSWCVTFFYHMLGHTMGELSVFTRDIQTGKENVTFRLTKKENKDTWVEGRFSFKPSLNPLQIVFQGKSSFGYYGDIAIDDIKISRQSSCYFWPPEAIPKTIPPLQPPNHGPESRLTCGTTSKPIFLNKTSVRRPLQRILGGNPAIVGAWPWMAMLLSSQPGVANDITSCGGTLLGVNWIITAAHCVATITKKTHLKVRLGAHKISSGNPSKGDYDVEGIYVHPDYRRTVEHNNDVALIKLRTPAVMNAGVNSICLMENQNEPAVGEKLYIAGWGKLWDGKSGMYPKVLQDGEVKMQSEYNCFKTYGGLITDSMFCAGEDWGIPDTCEGDSGGPIMFAKNGRWYLAGITSWGHSGGCGQIKRYGVYTRMKTVESWIKSVTKSPDSHTMLHYE